MVGRWAERFSGAELRPGRGDHRPEGEWLGWAATALAGVLLASTAADITWRLAQPGDSDRVEPESPGAGTLSVDEQRPTVEDAGDSMGLAEVRGHLFGEPQESGEEPLAQRAPDTIPESERDLTLNGVVAKGGEGVGSAVIAHEGEQGAYPVGAELPGGAELAYVLGDRAILAREDEDGYEALPLREDEALNSAVRAAQPQEELAFTAGSGSSHTDEAASDEGHLYRHEVETLHEDFEENPGRLRDMFAVTPVLDGGQIQGVRVRPHDEDGQQWFRQTGLEEGDVIQRVEGIPVRDERRLRALAEQIDRVSELELQVERDGEEQEITVDLY